MGRTFLRQDAQIRQSVTFDDTVAAGSTMESSSTDLETDLNTIRSQIKRYAGEAKWYTDKSGRDLATASSDLLDLENKKLLFRAQVLTDITVPAQVRATGTLTGVTAQNFANTEAVTIGTKVYVFQTVLTDVDGNVLIGADMDASLANLKAAINLEAGGGTTYAASTTLHPTVEVTAAGSLTMSARAKSYGTGGNAIATTETAAQASWGATTLTGGAGDVKVLVQASSETPTEAAAVDAGTANGTLVKVLTGDVGIFSLAEITGANAINPKNLVILRDATTGDALMDGTHEIYGLIQAELGVADGDAFNDTTKQVQLSFVRENNTADDLIACTISAIAGKVINYSYARRINLDAIPEQAFLTGAFVDQSASVDVTLDNAIDNQSGPATQQQSIDWRIDDNYVLQWSDSAGGNLMKLMPAAAGDELQLDIDTLDVNNSLDADFLNGATFDSGGTPIRVGVTAGYVDTASADLGVRAGGELYLDDANQTGSTWAQTAGIKLSETTNEWDAFETAYGEVSLLNAIVAAKNAARSKTVGVLTGNVAADNNVTGAAGSPNLDAQLGDYSTKTFVTDVDIYLNGQLLRNGANSSANHDVYPGTAPATGDLKFEFALHGTGGNPDVVTMIIW